MYSFISLRVGPVPDRIPDDSLIPVLVRQSDTDGGGREVITYHFALLMKVTSAAGDDVNSIEDVLLRRLGFSERVAQPMPQALANYLGPNNTEGDTRWQLYTSHEPTDPAAPVLPFNQTPSDAGYLPSYLSITPPPVQSDAIQVPTALVPTANAEAMAARLNPRAKDPFGWLRNIPQLSRRFYFKNRGSDACVPGFELSFTAGFVRGDQLPAIPGLSLQCSFEGPLGRFARSPQNIEFARDVAGWTLAFVGRFSPGERLDALAVPHGLMRVALESIAGEARALTATIVEAETRPAETFRVAAPRGVTFRGSAGAAPATNLPTRPGTPDANARDRLLYALRPASAAAARATNEPPIALRFDAALPDDGFGDLLEVHLRDQTAEWVGAAGRMTLTNIAADLVGGAQVVAGLEVAVDAFRTGALPGLFTLADVLGAEGTPDRIALRFTLRFELPTSGSSLRTVLAVEWNLLRMELASPRCHFVLAPHSGDRMALHFGLFSLEARGLDRAPGPPSAAFYHGYFDFQTGSFVVQPKVPGGKPRPKLVAVCPGGPWDAAADGQPAGWFEAHLVPYQPAGSAEEADLRISAEGVTFKAQFVSSPTLFRGRVAVGRPVVATPTTDDSGAPFELTVDKSVITAGTVRAVLQVPACDDLDAALTFTLAADGAAGPPRFTGEIDAEFKGLRRTTTLSRGRFDLTVTDLSVRVVWVPDADPDLRWDVQAFVDGEIAIPQRFRVEAGWEDFRASGLIIVRRLNLMELTERVPRVGVGVRLQTTRKLRFRLFGVLKVEMDELSLSWTELGEVRLTARHFELNVTPGGSLRGGAGVGTLTLLVKSEGVDVEEFSGIGFWIEVVGKFKFCGELGWGAEGTTGGRYVAVRGELETAGLPRVFGLLKLGGLRKSAGLEVQAAAAFAARDFVPDVPLATGVVLKSAGVGAGWNYRLGALGPDPTVEDVLQNIDTLDPTQFEGWQPVAEAGDYGTLVGRVILGSNPGGMDAPGLYAMSLVFAVDSRGRVVSAMKLWLLSSARFAADNPTRPSAVGAAVFRRRPASIEGRVVTRRGGAIERLPWLAAILDDVEAELEFALAADRTDIHLKRVAYEQSLFGVTVRVAGRLRFSSYRGTTLLYARVQAQGEVRLDGLEGERCGVSAGAALDAELGYAGIVGPDGAATLADLNVDLAAWCEAYVVIEFRTRWFECNWQRCREDWLVWSERYSAHLSASLRVSGQVGFRSGSGGTAVGMRAHVHFDASVCGYPVPLTVAYADRPEVLDDTRARVLAFEDALDRAAAGSPVARSAAPRPAGPRRPAGERWFAFQRSYQDVVDEREVTRYAWVLLPRFATEWLTPRYERVPTEPGREPANIWEAAQFRFRGHVTRIEVTPGTGSPVTVVPPWDHGQWPFRFPSTDDPAVRWLYRLNFLMQDTAELPPRTVTKATATPPAAERSTDGYLLVSDRRVRSPSRDFLRDEDRFTLPDGVRPFTFRPLADPDYEKWERFADWAARAGGGVTELDRRFRARAAAVEAVLQEFEQGRADLFGNSIEVDSRRIGPYIVRGSAAVDFASVAVTREGAVPVAADVYTVDAGLPAKLRDAIRGLPVCQEFERSPSAEGNGTVVVKLPLDLRGLFYKPGTRDERDATLYETLRHFRVFRVFAGGTPVPAPGGAAVAAPVTTVPPGGEENRTGLILLRSFLFTDRFPVVNGQFVAPGLRGPAPQVTYRVVPVPVGMTGRPDSDFLDNGLFVDLPPVELYVPKPVPFPTDLGLVADARQLLAPEAGRAGRDRPPFEFRLFRQTGGASDGLNLAATDFEVMVEPVTPGQTGFYGEADGTESARERDEDRPPAPAPGANDPVTGRSARAAAGAAAGRFVAPRGRRPLKVVDVPDRPNTFRVADPGAVPSSGGLRFFIRPRAAGEAGLLQPLPAFLAEPDGAAARSDNAFRPVGHLEWFRRSDLAGRYLDFARLDEVAAVPATAADPRHRIRVAWNGVVPADGGVEIEVHDLLTDRPIVARRVEVLDADEFRLSHRDFSSRSLWQVVGPSGGSPPRVLRNTDDGPPELAFWDFGRYFRTPGDPSRAALDELDRQAGMFADADNGRDYAALAAAAWTFWTYVAQFLGDEQNDYSADVVAAVHELEGRLVMAFAGLFPIGDDPAAAAGFEARYRERRDAALAARPDDGATGESDVARENRARDVVAARTIVNALEARRQRAYEIVEGNSLSLDRGRTAFAALAADRPVGLELELDLLTALEPLKDITVAQKWADGSLDAAYPVAMWFVRRLFVAPDPTPLESQVQGKQAAARLRAALTAFVDRASPAAGVGERAKVVRFVRPIRDALRLPARAGAEVGTFLARPHHALRIARGVGGPFRRMAVREPLAAFWQEPSPPAAPGDPPGIAFFHLLERLGFAADVAAQSDQRGILPQGELVAALRAAVGDPDGFDLFLVRGRAPDDGTSPADAVGFSFVTLGAVPVAFVTACAIGDTGQVQRWLDRASLDADASALRALTEDLARQFAWLLAAGERNGSFQQVWVEQAIDRTTAVPAVAERCRTVIDLPARVGRQVGVRVRTVSRYRPLAEWLAVPVDEPPPQGGATAELEFPPYYAADGFPAPLADPAAYAAVGFALADRVYFIVPPAADALNAAANARAAVRSGYRGVETRLQYRAITAGGPKSATLDTILGLAARGAAPDARPERAIGIPPGPAADFPAPLFPGELALGALNLSYQYEVALDVRHRYDAAFDPDGPSPRPAPAEPAFYRRGPRVVSYREPRAGAGAVGLLRDPGFGGLKGTTRAEDPAWFVEPAAAVLADRGDEGVRLGVVQVAEEMPDAVALVQHLPAARVAEFLRAGRTYRAEIDVDAGDCPGGEVRLAVAGADSGPVRLRGGRQTVSVAFRADGQARAADLVVTWRPAARRQTLRVLRVRVADASRFHVPLASHQDNLTPDEVAAAPDAIAVAGHDIRVVPDMAYSFLVLLKQPQPPGTGGGADYIALGALQLPWAPDYGRPGGDRDPHPYFLPYAAPYGQQLRVTDGVSLGPDLRLYYADVTAEGAGREAADREYWLDVALAFVGAGDRETPVPLDKLYLLAKRNNDVVSRPYPVVPAE